MASDGSFDFAAVRSRVALLRRPDLQECLDRLGLSKQGNKAELQRRLLDMFETSHHLMSVSNGQPHQKMWQVTAAQRVIEDVYDRMVSSGSYGRPTRAQAAPAAGAAAVAAPGRATGSDAGKAGGSASHHYANGGARHAGAAGGVGGHAGGSGNRLADAMTAYIRTQMASQTHAGVAQTRTVRCPCGSTLERGIMLQCRAAGCGVWQHANCVGVGGDAQPAGGPFHCELCRAKRADPFWEVLEAVEIMAPARLNSNNKHMMVNNVNHKVRTVERHFNITSAQHAKFRSRQNDSQLQLACLQLNDALSFRFHWPLNTNLEVNHVQYRVYSRNNTQKLGANGRDEPANISTLCAPGRNHLVMSCADNSPYVVLVLLVRRRSVADVRQLMAPQLSIPDAVERVRQQLHADADDELSTERTVLSLRCPILGSRMRTPGRFREVRGLACFDLEAFLEGAARTRKWQCPNSMAHSSVHSLQIDTYLQRILECLVEQPNVLEVEVSPEGTWRPAGSKERFYSIQHDDPESFVRMAKERLLANGGAGGAGGGADGARAGGSDDEEEDEEEELRQAAAAVASQGQKRKRPPSPEVIVIDSDEEDEGAPPVAPAAQQPVQPEAAAAAGADGNTGTGSSGHSRQQAPGMQAQQPSAGGAQQSGGGGLRIRLGPRLVAAPGGAGVAVAPHGGGVARAPAAAVQAGHVAAQRQHFEGLAHQQHHSQQHQQGQGQAQGQGPAANAAAPLLLRRLPQQQQPAAAGAGAGGSGGGGAGAAAYHAQAPAASGAAGGESGAVGSSVRQPAGATASRAATDAIRILLANAMDAADAQGAGHVAAAAGVPAGLPAIWPYNGNQNAAAAGGVAAVAAGANGGGVQTAGVTRWPRAPVGPANGPVPLVLPFVQQQQQQQAVYGNYGASGSVGQQQQQQGEGGYECIVIEDDDGY